MQRRPLIGLNADFRSATKDQPAFSFLCAGYFNSVSAAGGIPVIVPPLENEEDIQCVLDQLHGFVLVGGPDLDPHRDGFMRHPAVRPMDPRREEFDRTLMRLIMERRLPVFGIGVGVQLLNITLGGSVHLHIPEDVPSALPHKDRQDPGHRHGLEVTPGSMMERVYGDGEIRVNSMHHMALDDIANGLVVTARCPDGIAEAVESQMEDWVVMGTQFHPEADSASALDVRIFEEFIAAITGVAPEVRLVA